MKDLEMVLQDARMEGCEEVYRRASRIAPVLLQARAGKITMTDAYNQLIAEGFSRETIDEMSEILVKYSKEEKMSDKEKAAYLHGRWDKAKEVVQDLYCNHGGNSHPVYDFFQDSEIKYEDITGWKMEAQQHLEQKVIEKRAKETALQLLLAGMDTTAAQASIKEWFHIDLPDSSIKFLAKQVKVEKNFSKIADAIERKSDHGKT